MPSTFFAFKKFIDGLPGVHVDFNVEEEVYDVFYKNKKITILEPRTAWREFNDEAKEEILSIVQMFHCFS
jgi:hypothetical protein